MTARTRPVAVVVGAAGGIGSAVVARLVEQGRQVVAVDQSPATGQLASAEVSTLVADVVEPAALPEAFRLAAQRGPIDSVVHCVLAESRGPLTELDRAALARVFEVGVTSATEAVQLLHRLGTRPAAGVLVGSIHAGLALPSSGAYAMGKAALRALNRAAAIEWGRADMRCNLVEPGFVAVARNRARWAGPAQRERIERAHLRPRLAVPADVAAVVAFLLSSDACYVNGAVIPVDGGASALFTEESP